MSISDKTFSLEVVPQSLDTPYKNMKSLLKDFKSLSPDFVGVPAIDKINMKKKTIDLAQDIEKELGVPSMLHLPAKFLNLQSAVDILDSLTSVDVRKVLLVGGEVTDDAKIYKDFIFASSLAEFVAANYPSMQITGASHPAGVDGDYNLDKEISDLKRKIRSGISNFISQVFFDIDIFYNFYDKYLNAGITNKLSVGMMPITSYKQVHYMAQRNHTKLPKNLQELLEKYEYYPLSFRQAGLEYSLNQIESLKTNDIQNLHAYSMNDFEATKSFRDMFFS